MPVGAESGIEQRINRIGRGGGQGFDLDQRGMLQ